MVLVLIVPIVDFCAMAAAVSIVLVLFALAPLGSLYVLLINLQSTTTTTSILPTETTALIMDLLKKNHLLMTGAAEGSNTTTTTSLDELWTSVIASISEDPAFSELLRQRTIHHLRLVVPWIVTFIILAITAIPCIVVGTARHRRYHRHKNPHRIRKVVAAALDCLVAKSTMKTTTATTTTTEGHGICGICLEGLPDGGSNHHQTEDDVVVVLGVCCHAFHEHCISHWLCRRRSHYQCPMCRQDFFDVSTTRKLKRMSGSYYAAA
jgi:Anaphase-promoting complex subunit 11 RING-H2 finger